jgi:S-adenosylmethionine:tRNA ribosyltransferase-isomerase
MSYAIALAILPSRCWLLSSKLAKEILAYALALFLSIRCNLIAMRNIINDYDYELPVSAIAQRPASVRDQAKLLVYDRKSGKASCDRFINLGKYLPKNSVLVFNETKVVPARLAVKKPTGGKVELFYVGILGTNLRCLTNQPVPIGTVLHLKKNNFTVVGREDKWYLVKPPFAAKEIFSFLEKNGKTPLPPYLKNSPLSERERRKKYQTVFARAKGSVAAPTASLHFTDRLIKKLKKLGVRVVYITLHVNLGTFAPVTETHLKKEKLHAEEYEITREAAKRLNAAKKAGKNIIAVGTTSCRALESATTGGKLKKLSGTTDIFIRPPYDFKFVDSLITNFHVPRSSLLMLVASLVGRKKLFKLYDLALEKKMRFLSFGDGMFIL